MENQHRKIKGYRELNQDEINLMNEIKEEGLRLQAIIDKVEHVTREVSHGTDGGRELVEASQAYRWASIAKTDFQTGLMALTRAVAKPEFF